MNVLMGNGKEDVYTVENDSDVMRSSGISVVRSYSGHHNIGKAEENGQSACWSQWLQSWDQTVGDYRRESPIDLYRRA